MAKAKKASSDTLELKRLEEARLVIPIIGLTPLIPHRWSEKAKSLMPGHPDHDTVKDKKGVRLPEEEAESCLYRLSDGRTAMPATAFKAAIVAACRFFDKPAMVECKMMIYVEGEGPEQLVPIVGELLLREDTPRNSNGNSDLRYRYSLLNWRAQLAIRFIPSSLSPSSVVSLVDAAGRCGVGDWRPSSPKSYTGTFGTWRIDEKGKIK